MLTVFVVHLDESRTDDAFLSDELLEETGAQVMSVAEAKAIGFTGVPDDPNIRLVAVAPKDKRFVHAALERAESVTGFDAQDVAI